VFKGSNYLDAITRVNAIVFDKTGTLTTGSFRVTSMQAAGLTEDELLRLVLSVEKKSTHPVAQAVARFAAERGVEPLEVTTLNELAGYGLEAEVGPRKVLVGNIRLLKDRKITVPEELTDCVATVVVCAIDGQYAGCLLLSDTLKEDAMDAIKKIKGYGHVRGRIELFQMDGFIFGKQVTVSLVNAQFCGKDINNLLFRRWHE